MRHAKSTPASSNDESTGPLSLQDRFDKLANRHRLTEPTTPLHSSMGVSASNTSSSIQVKKNAESALQDFSTAPLTGTRTSKASSSGRSHGFNYINDRLGLDAAGPRIKPATGGLTAPSISTLSIKAWEQTERFPPALLAPTTCVLVLRARHA